MQHKILDGKTLSKTLQQQLKQDVAKRSITPCLAVILVGNDPASKLYVQKKQEMCNFVGIESTIFKLKSDISFEELLKLVIKINNDKKVNGILIQLPLPKHLEPILHHIDNLKDVDGFNPYNLGLLAQGTPALRPCTPLGIMQLLGSINFELQGVNAVVVGNSNIVGLPMSLELLNHKATVTVCHEFTKDLDKIVSKAELLIVAVGKPHLIKASWLQKDSVVIDIGINRIDNKIIGDVEFDKALPIVKYITPVPGGVGPMTVVTLGHNTLLAQKLQLAKIAN